ncbi:hypothetical protein NEUTE1DRAFT_111787 [Neurospora tetrasperma FGSC 2508]|uniref:Uncharacterized protein n=1 Tax=Neurospora tetrasperma (strain FGSC 2508 / ATCC MYA-4615 / P0657) TaxID=510951 RepID=F8MT98_NEUT8|nr:uncharacterized protein NEUTE1DRAFT_111787 [Neurospora tetrasperma FGSC 2508]EGO55230.1 hypothetical protein NEUTE1DRAFT_111787 [Neurospora tetrasperma FGSC 2508]EGZ69552.1 hypothetical protein NEUTE2DRAFT_141120 [Neurospora tetrasperma FGSC 2509]
MVDAPHSPIVVILGLMCHPGPVTGRNDPQTGPMRDKHLPNCDYIQSPTPLPNKPLQTIILTAATHHAGEQGMKRDSQVPNAPQYHMRNSITSVKMRRVSYTIKFQKPIQNIPRGTLHFCPSQRAGTYVIASLPSSLAPPRSALKTSGPLPQLGNEENPVKMVLK